MKTEFEHGIEIAAIVACVLGAVVLFWVSGCAKASSGARAVEIPGPVNVVCYAIEDETGKTVGGNCLWTR